MAQRKDTPDIRALMYDAIERYPGLHLRGIERQLGVSAPLVQYHVRHLEDAGFIESREQGGYVRFYPTPKAKSARLTPADQTVLGLLREEVPLHIALLLLDDGPLTHAQLVERLDVAKSTVSYHLHKLAQAGIVTREPNDPRLHLSDRERLYRLILAHRPTPDLLDRFARLWEDLYG